MFITQSLRERSAPLQLAAWRRFAEWAGAPLVEVARPYLYQGRGGRRALTDLAEAAAGNGGADGVRIGLEPADEFAPMPGALNALSLTWPYSGSIPRVAGQASLIFAGSRHSLAAAQRAEAEAALLPPPILIEEASGAPSEVDLSEITVWWTLKGAAELAPGRLTDFLAARRGPLFCARLCPSAEPRALRSLLAAAEALVTGRLLVIIAAEPLTFAALRAAHDLDGSGLATRDRLGFVVDDPEAIAGDAVARAAQFVVAPSSSTAARAAEDHLWFARAIAAGCAPIGPAGGGLEDLLPEHTLCRPAVERPQAWEREAVWRVEDASPPPGLLELESDSGPPPRGWAVSGPSLSAALAAAETAGETTVAALVGEALSRMCADRGFEAVRERLAAACALQVGGERA